MCDSITITLGDRAENHNGMQIIGNEMSSGFSTEDLELINNFFKQKGFECEIWELHKNFGDDYENFNLTNASILVVKNGITCFVDKNDLWAELSQLEVDKKALMRGRLVNKRARYNLCFADYEQNPDYENGRGKIYSFNSCSNLQQIRSNICNIIKIDPSLVVGEGNYYYDIKKCGIGYHGDSERKIVIGLRLGKPFPLVYQWYCQSKPIGKKIQIDLDDGDIYFMSEKAVGFDWKKRKTPTLRHAAGCTKYTNI